MSQSKHTPGPLPLFYSWQVTDTPVKRHNRISIVDGGRCHIADISADNFDTYSLEEKQAHARIIAAAPELLAMVENMVSFLESQGLNKSAQYIHGIELIIKARGE